MNGSMMSGTVAAGGTAPGRDPILQRLANRIFRCSHRHKSHALTPKGEAERYAVCLDCGARLVPNLPALPVDTLVHREPRAARRLSLMAFGLAGASVFWMSRHPVPIARPSGRIVSSVSPADTLQFSAATTTGTDRTVDLPAASGNPQASRSAPLDRSPHAASPARAAQASPRLESKGSIVVLGRDPASTLELSQHPAALGTLIQNGALFAVSRGTLVKICQHKDRISQVQILEGSRRGQEGWVPTWQIATP